MDDSQRDDTAVAELPARVATAFESGLRATANPLLQVDGGLDDLLTQARAVVVDVTTQIRADRDTHPPADTLTAAIGARRASDQVDPVESVRAAALLFEVALPVLADGLRPWEPDAREVARRLNRTVLERIAVGSVSFGAFLMEKVRTSHAEERRRMARELHDRIAHGVAVALQQVELAEVYGRTDRHRSDVTIASVGSTLRGTLDDVRRLSQDIRETVADEGRLDRALASFLTRRAGDVHTDLSVTGDCTILPTVIAEELYVVLREAVRNTLRHAGGSCVHVVLDVGATEVRGSVTDDGRGFVPDAAGAGPGHGFGMLSMRERIDLLGGTITIDSAPGTGTVVAVAVPLRWGAT